MATTVATTIAPELISPGNLPQSANDVRLSDIPVSGPGGRDIRDDEQAPDHATEALPDGGYGWTIVASSFLLLFWINGYANTWGVLQTAIVKSPNLDTNLRTITFVGSFYMACIVAFGLVSVRISRKFGMRYSISGAVIVLGAGLIATSFTLEHLAGLFCVSGLVMGLATSLLFTACNTLPTLWFNNRLGLANGLTKMGGGVGATVLPLAAQGLTDKLGLEWTFRAIGLLILATGIPCALLLKEQPRAGGATTRFDWSLMKNVPFLALAMAGAVGVFALYVPPFFLPLFANSIGLTPSTGAGLVAGFGASTTVGRLLGGWACDRIGAINTLGITALMNGLSMLAIWPVSTSLPPLTVFAIVNGCANGSFFVCLPTAVASLAPGSAAASISLMSSFWTPGYFLGPPLASILIETTGAAEASSIEPYRAAIFYAAGVGILATILIIFARLKVDSKPFKKV